MARTIAWLVVLALFGIALAQDKPKVGKVMPITLDKADKIDVKSGEWDKPYPVTADDDLKKFISDAPTRKKVLDAVDFKTHVLLVFAWQGSGGDRIAAAIAEDAPENVRFILKAGATDDVRQNIQLFAVPKEMRWTAK